MAVVTISRPIGALGTEISQRAAEILGYDLVDKDLITQVARAARVPESEVSRLDEVAESPVRTFLRELLQGSRTSSARPIPSSSLAWAMDFPYEFPAVLQQATDEGMSEEVHVLDQHECLRFVQQTVQHLWRRDEVIIVGRGAQMILAGLENVLHVRLTASEEFRCERVMEVKHCDYREALRIVRESDRRRGRYLKRFYHVDWEDPNLYHLVINTEMTGTELAAQIIAAGAMSIQKQGAGFPRSSPNKH